ncbi:hypothetical protein L1887_11614 [Cichorium endivia]|nr:hypothetical protein L1887_11614 [Cichorium endivia]
MTASQTVRVEFGMWRRLFHNMKKKQLIALHHPKNIILLLSTKNIHYKIHRQLCLSDYVCRLHKHTHTLVFDSPFNFDFLRASSIVKQRRLII